MVFPDVSHQSQLISVTIKDGNIYCQTNHPSTTNLPISLISKHSPSAPPNLCCISPSHQPIPRRMYAYVQRSLSFDLDESSSQDIKVHWLRERSMPRFYKCFSSQGPIKVNSASFWISGHSRILGSDAKFKALMFTRSNQPDRGVGHWAPSGDCDSNQ